MIGSERNTALDGVRGLACLFVIFGHLIHFRWLGNVHDTSYLGVFIFFVLSGFLMAALYDPPENTPARWGKFIIQRFFRIYPMLLISTLVIWWLADQGILRNTTHNCRGITPHESLMIAQLLLYKGWCSFWTIPVEMHFYAAFIISVVALNLLNLRPNTKILLVGIIFIVIALLTKLGPRDRQLIMVMYGDSYPTMWKYSAFFIAGVFTGLLYKYYNAYLQKYAVSFGVISLFITACLILYLIPLTNTLLPKPNYFWTSQFHLLILPALISAYIFSSALAQYPFNILINSHLLCFIGRISYSLYIVNYIVFMIALRYLHYPKDIMIMMVLAWNFVIAYISYLAIEKPGITLGKKVHNWIINDQPHS